RQDRAQPGAAAFLQALRQRPLHLRSALAEVGLSARLGHRHAAAEAEGARAHHGRLQGLVGGGARRQEQPQVRRVSRSVDRGLAQDARALREMKTRDRRYCAAETNAYFGPAFLCGRVMTPLSLDQSVGGKSTSNRNLSAWLSA